MICHKFAILSEGGALQLRASMTTTSILDPVAERVELLLAKYEALVQTNRLLTEEIEAVRKERDSLQSRLKAARARVDDLIERLPANREAS